MRRVREVESDSVRVVHENGETDKIEFADTV